MENRGITINMNKAKVMVSGLQCFDAVVWAAGRESGLCWRGYLSGVRCRFAYGPADATATQ